MEIMESSIDLSKPLSNDLSIKEAGNHFYGIGLSNASFGNAKRFKAYFNPIISVTIVFIFGLRCFISTLIKEKNSDLFIMIGDFCYFMNLQYHFNLLLFGYS